MSFINTNTINEVVEETMKELKANGWLDGEERYEALSKFDSLTDAVTYCATAVANQRNYSSLNEYIDSTYDLYIALAKTKFKEYADYLIVSKGVI